ncbi:MAG: histidine phosphatase family protein [Actinomycetaceae bacterium]|nr:histidine phosphatase family protein [Arcanobacterium sp.]MDD7505212.1 histidine phosphatase family protein [Actinomycetaceae bacterium]MDY6143300.1 histidine phosphatase family protein [Arcanobacterium sp.]
MDFTTIHLVRHGEVDNPSGVLYGRRPGFHLTKLGLEMAEGVAQAFRTGHDVRAVVASPLERAVETATPTAQAFGLPVITDSDLIEADNYFEGLQLNKNPYVLALPKYWVRIRNPFEPSWGERYREVVARMSRAIARGLALAPDGGEVVMVSHQLPIWVTRLFLEGKSVSHNPKRRECSLCSVTSLTFSGKQLVSVDYWEPVKHLLAQAQDMVPGTSEAALKRPD